MMTYGYAQHRKRNYINNNQFWLCMGQIYNRRIPIVICVTIGMVLSFHIIQTGLFLFQHFIETEDINDMVKLDMNLWQHGFINDKLSTKIPRHIHQIWISSIENKSMPEKFQKASDSCIELHSNYNYTLWTHNKILIWLKKEYPWFLPLYQSYRYDMQRIDAMKYLLLLHFGGLYIDLDIKCNVHDLITAMTPINHTDNEPDIIFHMGGEGISANTDIIAAKQYHPFFKLAVNRLKAANRWFYLYHFTIILSAGPTFLYGIYRKYPLKESFYFIPNDLLWGKLIGGVGGATCYGKDTLILIYFMENAAVSCFLLIIIIICIFSILRFLRKKRY